ncbi:hypothetical protein [Flavihumibacter petaseus]|uniref:Uncharacterized protein n=1 Tax=Flavihumibacter petaseus NBRC 106054 TaxID=1220578 RepID=A0A0E9N251_9BACT|nr:hypothetical protein [Flavihumibacter petaseus]GAO43904.1 hypothetical protein FPE01S_02_10100 [Flavihumibacter petaseus NBRC 106054]
MTTYADLQAGNFYLIRGTVNGEIELISLLALTEKCVLLRSFGQMDADFWRKREDTIHEVIEELDYDSASAILSLYDDEDEDDLSWEDDEDE